MNILKGVGVVAGVLVLLWLVLKLLGFVFSLFWAVLPVVVIAFLGYQLFKYLQKKGV